MGKVGKPQDAIDQGNAERAKRQLRAIRGPGDQNIVEESHDGIQDIHQFSTLVHVPCEAVAATSPPEASWLDSNRVPSE